MNVFRQAFDGEWKDTDWQLKKKKKSISLTTS